MSEEHPPPTDPTDTPDHLPVLTAHCRHELDQPEPQSKVYRRAGDGFEKVSKEEFLGLPPGDRRARAWRYTARLVPVPTLHALEFVLRELERAPYTCVIRGTPRVGADLGRTRRHADDWTDHPEGRRWVAFDLDKVAVPDGWDWDDASRWPELLRALVVDQLGEPFASCGLVVQLSSSALLSGRGLIGLHVWARTISPVCSASLNAWAKALKSGGSGVDPRLFQAVQKHYCAAPIIQDAPDPLAGRRTHLLPGPPLDPAQVPAAWGWLDRPAQRAIEEARQRAQEREDAQRAAERARRAAERRDRGEVVPPWDFHQPDPPPWVEDLLESVSARVVREDWLAVAGILKGMMGEGGLALWRWWSLGANYGAGQEHAVRETWRSAPHRGEHWGKLLGMGRRWGWTPPWERPGARRVARARQHVPPPPAPATPPPVDDPPPSPVEVGACAGGAVEVLEVGLGDVVGVVDERVRRVLREGGRLALRVTAGAGKSTTTRKALAATQPERIAELLRLEGREPGVIHYLAPTLTTVGEAAEGLREDLDAQDTRSRGYLSSDSVAAHEGRNEKSCHRFPAYLEAQRVREGGGGAVCSALCPHHPQYQGEGRKRACPFMQAQGEAPGGGLAGGSGRVRTMTHAAWMLLDSHEQRGDVLVIDEHIGGEVVQTLTVDAAQWNQLARLLCLPTEAHARVALLLAASADGRARFLGDQLAEELAGLPWGALEVSEEGDAQRLEAIGRAARELNSSVACDHLAEWPDWRAPAALASAVARNMAGACVQHGRLELMHLRPFDVSGYRCVIVLDATMRQPIARLLLGGDARVCEVRVRYPEHFGAVWYAEARVGKGSVQDGEFRRGRAELVEVAARLHYDSPKTFHVTSQAFRQGTTGAFLEGLEGRVTHFNSGESVGSNAAKDFRCAVLNEYHANGGAVELRAVGLCVWAGESWADEDARARWLDEARYLEEVRPFYQALERVRGVRATAERPVRVVLLSRLHPVEDLGLPAERVEIGDLGQLLFDVWGVASGPAGCAAAVRGVLERNGGAWCPHKEPHITASEGEGEAPEVLCNRHAREAWETARDRPLRKYLARTIKQHEGMTAQTLAHDFMPAVLVAQGHEGGGGPGQVIFHTSALSAQQLGERYGFARVEVMRRVEGDPDQRTAEREVWEAPADALDADALATLIERLELWTEQGALLPSRALRKQIAAHKDLPWGSMRKAEALLVQLAEAGAPREVLGVDVLRERWAAARGWPWAACEDAGGAPPTPDALRRMTREALERVTLRPDEPRDGELLWYHAVCCAPMTLGRWFQHSDVLTMIGGPEVVLELWDELAAEREAETLASAPTPSARELFGDDATRRVAAPPDPTRRLSPPPRLSPEDRRLVSGAPAEAFWIGDDTTPASYMGAQSVARLRGALGRISWRLPDGEGQTQIFFPHPDFPELADAPPALVPEIIDRVLTDARANDHDRVRLRPGFELLAVRTMQWRCCPDGGHYSDPVEVPDALAPHLHCSPGQLRQLAEALERADLENQLRMEFGRALWPVLDHLWHVGQVRRVAHHINANGWTREDLERQSVRDDLVDLIFAPLFAASSPAPPAEDVAPPPLALRPTTPPPPTHPTGDALADLVADALVPALAAGRLVELQVLEVNAVIQRLGGLEWSEAIRQRHNWRLEPELLRALFRVVQLTPERTGDVLRAHMRGVDMLEKPERTPVPRRPLMTPEQRGELQDHLAADPRAPSVRSIARVLGMRASELEHACRRHDARGVQGLLDDAQQLHEELRSGERTHPNPLARWTRTRDPFDHAPRWGG